MLPGIWCTLGEVQAANVTEKCACRSESAIPFGWSLLEEGRCASKVVVAIMNELIGYEQSGWRSRPDNWDLDSSRNKTVGDSDTAHSTHAKKILRTILGDHNLEVNGPDVSCPHQVLVVAPKTFQHWHAGTDDRVRRSSEWRYLPFCIGSPFLQFIVLASLR